jgi:hypothetical protein
LIPASQRNEIVASLHKTLEHELAKKVEEGSEEEMTLTFDGDSIKSTWMVPEMAPAICAICGKGCIEKGLPMCINGNPFCG